MSGQKQQYGSPEDVTRFNVGDTVMTTGQPLQNDQEWGVCYVGEVIRLKHEDATSIYHMPVVQFDCLNGKRCMMNPDFIVVVKRADGSPGEVQLPEDVADAPVE